MDEFKWPPGLPKGRQDFLARIVWTIYLKGPIESNTGRATALLAELLPAAGVNMSAQYLNKNLLDLGTARFGKLVRRTMVGKRTYRIEVRLAPSRLPPNPFEDAGNDLAEWHEPEGELESLVEASTALDVLPEPSITDKILYIQSMLGEILNDLLIAPERNFEAQINERLSYVNQILERNALLEEANEKLRQDKRTLAAALGQNNQILRDRTIRNGTPTGVNA